MNTKRRMRDGREIMDADLTFQVETPHVPWARPYHKGPVKAFFLPSVKGGRDYVELMQRLETKAVSVTHDRAWDLDKWGFGDFYDKRVRIWEYETVYSYMVDALESDEQYDVLVLHSVNGWSYWPKEARAAVLRRVKEGAGLVLVRPFDGPRPTAELKALSPLQNGVNDTINEGGYAVIAAEAMRTGVWQAKGNHFITRNVPLDALCYDDMAYFPYKAKGEVILAAGRDPIAAVGEVGCGRVVAFAYYNRDLMPQHKDHVKEIGGLSSNSDFWRGGFSSCTWNWREYVYELLAKATLWAARKEPETDLHISVANGAHKAVKVTLGGAAEGTYEVNATVSNQWGAEELKFEKTITTGAGGGETMLVLPESTLAAGVHFADVIVKADGKAVDFGAARFELERPARIGVIGTDKEIYGPKEGIVAQIPIEGKGGPYRLEVAIVDSFGRVASQSFQDAASGSTVRVELARAGVITPQMWVTAKLTERDRIVDRAKSARLVAVPDYDRNIHDVELVVAQYDRGMGDTVEPIRKQLLAFGATNGYYGYSKILAESGAEGGGVYWYHRAPYIERKEKYLRTKDKKWLTRVPCLSDGEFLKEVHEKIVRTAAVGKKYAPLSYYVQDEGSLTCYSDDQDLCFGMHTIEAMRQWLKAEYKDIRKLNAEWGTAFKSWDKVVPMTMEEARAHGNYAPWADHRTFMEMAFAGYFRLVRDSVREVDADARIRLSGCQVSSAHTGMDYWRLHQIFEYFEAYSGGNQFEFHLSFKGPRTILGTWIGYGQRGRASNHRIWNSFFHQIRLFSVFWEFAVINPDYTLCGSAEEMAATFRQLCGSGVSRMLFDAQRDDSQIAIHYSYPSIHASYAVGKFPRFNQCREGWLAILEAAGYQQSFLSRQQIEAGELTSRKFKVLIMPYSMAVSPKEVVEIKRFVRAGGRVIGDFQTAVMDDHCVWRERGALDDVFGIARLNMRNDVFYINSEPRRTEHLPKIGALDVQEASVTQEEPGVRAKTGQALFLDDFSHHIPSVVINDYGKGKAAYLNFSTDIVARDPNSNRAKAVIAGIAEILGYFGARPIMKITASDGKPLTEVETFHYRVPGIDYFALLRENVGTAAVMAYDGIVHAKAEGESVAEPIHIDFPAFGHIYDVLKKTYMGRGMSVDTTVEPAEAKVFAILPYEVKDLAAFAEAAGNRVSYDMEVIASSGKPREHTVVLEVTSPSGELNRLYSRNILAKGGRAHGEILFSLEGESGTWTLRFTEAASGISKLVEVVV